MSDEQMVWVEDRAWQVLGADDTRSCERRVANLRVCRQPAIAVAKRHWRNKGQRWVACCPNHLFGRRVEGDRVLCAVDPESLAAQRGYVE